MERNPAGDDNKKTKQDDMLKHVVESIYNLGVAMIPSVGSRTIGSFDSDATMHVIWVNSQEMGRYKHFPKSGLEKYYTSMKDFYKPDELKYGRGDQRGQIPINSFDEHEISLIWKKQDHQKKFCGGSWRSPGSYDQKKHDCEYYAKWKYYFKKRRSK